MNRCDISEDETTAAVYALFPAPVPETLQHLQGSANGNVAAGISDGTGPRKKARKKPVQQLDGFDDEEAKEVKNGIDMACKFLSNPDNQMKNLPGNESLTEKGFKNGKAAAKKIKLKHFGDTQHSASGQDNSRDLVVREAKLKKHRDDNDFQTFRGIHGDETERSNATEARVVRSLKREAGSSYDASVKERKKLSLLRPREQLTAKDIDELKKDLGFEQISAAANSSSSTPFDCAKSKGSPQESVSSFPMRKFRPKQALPVALDKVESKFDDPPNISHVMRFSKAMPKERPSCPAVDSGVETLKERRDGNGSHCASKNEVTTDAVCTLPDTIRKSSQDGTTPVKRGSMKPDCIRKERNARREDCDQPVDRGSDPMKQSRQNCNLDLPLENRESASHLCSSGSIESLKCCSTTSGLLDACAPGDTPKLLTVGLPHETTSRPADIPVAPEPCLKNGNARGVSASFSLKKSEEVLREAEELRSHADLIKNSGFDSESHYEYFKAGLKFLHGASLLEDCSGDGRKRMEINLMQTYGIAAKLFKTCGYEYEKSREMAAAALAYKCMEVAYLKLVYYKSSNSSKLWHELQSILLMFPQDESPSSSASDVDNFNNLALGEKAASKATDGSHTIFARSQSNFVRLLDFTRDANYGMEAVKKAHETFASAVAETKKNGDALASVKSVIDLSFHNVEELVALVSLALNDINSQPID
ncbi:hypothetical protein M569_03237 [Genlisea aurea]|uniref:CWZF3/5/7 THD domain-containing protein n=1 Tax=Genlisea aurea TaxID=192259 RepID=S8E6P9_9LAMI|nr:hypothetical protein M569_03237 [Genlisea aurea]